MSAVLLDTNVLLRLAEPASKDHLLVRSAIRHLAEQGDALLLVPQVVFEFWVVATRPLDVNGFGWNPEATHATLEQLQQRLPILEERPDVFERWLDLVVHRGVRGKRAHDARLAVTMESLGIDRILTFNVADFKSLGAQAIHPADCQ